MDSPAEELMFKELPMGHVAWVQAFRGREHVRNPNRATMTAPVGQKERSSLGAKLFL